VGWPAGRKASRLARPRAASDNGIRAAFLLMFLAPLGVAYHARP
jgi:hypothetical protein